MKKIEAIIRPSKLLELKEALSEAGFPAMTTYDVRGHGQEKGLTMKTWDGKDVVVDLLPKQKLEIVVSDEDAKKVVDLIMSISKTGNIGDGKIFVLPVEAVYTVRTGEAQ